MSNHKVETFLLEENMLQKHNNADTLSVIKIPTTEFTYVAKTADWIPLIGHLVSFILPDSIVPLDRPEFAFLGTRPKDARIRAKRLRGVVSYGLLVKAPEGLQAGDDAASALGVTHYEPDETGGRGWGPALGGIHMGGEQAPAPVGTWPKYDLENYLKYGRKVLVEGEMVYISEKTHGANGRYVFAATSDDATPKMHCGSRTEWKSEYSKKPEVTFEELLAVIKDEEKAKKSWEKIQNFKPKQNMWWQALAATPKLREFCEAHPNYAVYGEVYGAVQAFNYNAKAGEVWFAAFDILQPDGKWMGVEEFLKTCQTFGIPHVPVVALTNYTHEKMLELCEGKSLYPNVGHIREGVVIKPVVDRWSEYCGRVALKCINPAYLEKN